MTPTAVDLFAGAGGLTAGLQQAGFEVRAALDNWSPAVTTYRLNFPHPIIEADVRELTPREFLKRAGVDGPVDLVAGGPPCQGFSIQRIGRDDDHRNELIFDFVRYVAELRPRAFLMENVPGILGRRGGDIVSRLEDQLGGAGYEFRSTVINAADYGVPQVRRRVFYYGWPVGGRALRFPRPTRSVDEYATVWDAIGDLPSPADPVVEARDPLHRRSRLSELNLQRLALIPPGGGFADLPVELRVKAHKAGPDRIGHRNVYGRLAPDRPAGTITARFDSFTRGKFAHPFEQRNITLREGARLQTFEDQTVFSGTREDIAALIGNAIPPLLARAIGAAFLQDLLADDVSHPVPALDDQLRLFPVLVSRRT